MEEIVLSSESSDEGSGGRREPRTRVMDLCASPAPSLDDPYDYLLDGYRLPDVRSPSPDGRQGKENGSAHHAMSDSDAEVECLALDTPDSYGEVGCLALDTPDSYEERVSSNTNGTEDPEEEQSQASGRAEKKRKGVGASKEEREELKRIKDLEKAEKRARVEHLRRTKPGECVKYVTMVVDRSLSETDICSKALETVKESVAYRAVDQREPHSVTWRRQVLDGNKSCEQVENQILFVWPHTKILTSVKYCTLLETFRLVKKTNPDLKVTLIINGLTPFLRKLRSKEKLALRAAAAEDEESGQPRRKRKSKEDDVTASQIEMALAELEICLQVSHRLIDSPEDLARYFEQFTKAVAETPYRKEVEKRDMEKSWYVRADSRSCVRVDKDLNGLSRLWLQQLCQFNNSTVDVARAIAQLYPTPVSLYEAYRNCTTEKEKEILLKDVQVKRGAGPAASVRRIGPEMSKKLALMFGQSRGDIVLSQE